MATLFFFALIIYLQQIFAHPSILAKWSDDKTSNIWKDNESATESLLLEHSQKISPIRRLLSSDSSSSDSSEDPPPLTPKPTTKAPTPKPKTKAPTPSPTNDPSPAPTNNPSPAPTNDPTVSPTLSPLKAPSMSPTQSPTDQPSKEPTAVPTDSPSHIPSNAPSELPTAVPTNLPSFNPSLSPTNNPTKLPSNIPSQFPSNAPSQFPSIFPIQSPANNPTFSPSNAPSGSPTNEPTVFPSSHPTQDPTKSNNILRVDVDLNEQEMDENEVVDEIIPTADVDTNVNAEPANVTMLSMENLTENTLLIVAAFGGLCIWIFGCLVFVFMCKRKQKELMKKVSTIEASTNNKPSTAVSVIGETQPKVVEGNDTEINQLDIAKMSEVPKPSLKKTETLGTTGGIEEEISFSDDEIAFPIDTKAYIDDAITRKKKKPLAFNIRIVSSSGINEDDDSIDMEMDTIVDMHALSIDAQEDSHSATDLSKMYDKPTLKLEKQTTMGSSGGSRI